MIVLFIQNLGFFEWLIIISLVMLFVRRSTIRDAGRTVGRVTGGGVAAPPAPPPERLHAQFKIMELPPTASYEQVQSAYRDLVKVWHPDRFGSDEKLKEKATAKLQEINAAYEVLRLHFESLGQRR